MLNPTMANLGRQLEQTKNKEKEVAETAQRVKCLLCNSANMEWGWWTTPPHPPRQWELETAASHQNRVGK